MGIKYITTIIEEHKIEITICQNKCNKNCEEEKKTLLIKITLIQKELDICNKKKDCEVALNNCENKNKELNITINNTIKINIIKIDTCTKDLEVCHKGNKKVCDGNNITKYNNLFIKYTSLTLVYETTKGLYSKCQIDYNKLVIEIGELKRRKCETCEGSLKTCEQNITTITNNYNTKIEINITTINQLNIRIEQLQKECKNDYINIQLKLKTCTSTKIDIKNKYDICEFDLKNEINLRITYFKESANWHKEFKNCSKQAICKE